MIRFNLAKLMAEPKKKITIGEVAKGTGLHRNTVAAYYHERTKQISLYVLNRFCRFLDRKPGDFFDYIPDDEENLQEDNTIEDS